MTKFSRENIDEWLFHYNEGNLNPTEIEELEHFLLMNPGYQPDAEMWQQVGVEAEVVQYPHKDSLYQKKKVIPFWVTWGASFILLLISFTFGYYWMNDVDGFKVVDSTQLGINSGLNTNSSNRNLNTVQIKDNSLTNNNESDIQSNSQNNTSTTLYNVNATTNNSNSSVSISNSNLFTKSSTGTENNSVITNENSNHISINELERNLSENGLVAYDRSNTKAYLSDSESEILSYDYKAKYLNNPEVEQDAKNYKVKRSGSSRNSAWNRFKRKMKKMFDNPIGLTNLRDPKIILPEFNSIKFNPSFAGSMLNTRVELLARSQWIGSGQMLNTGILSVDSYIYGIRGGIGFYAEYNNLELGKYSDFKGALTYSPKIGVHKYVMLEPSFKFTAGYRNFKWNANDAGKTHEISRGNTFQESSSKPYGRTEQYMDLGVGLGINTKWFYAGVSVDNMMKHEQRIFSGEQLTDIKRAPVEVRAYLGTDYKASKTKIVLSPFLAYEYVNKKHEMWGGMNFKWNWMNIGASVSTNANVMATAGLQFKNFSINYSYDYSKSTALDKRLSSHQLGIRINTNKSRFARKLTH